ncbi:MAG: aminotransferase class V-fold PLP-dependent enzyme [Acidobacteria bacterium]|nr:aminotransferase class V-fold PLP-dependent enzyme [Acidobacteriota bacterium]
MAVDWTALRAEFPALARWTYLNTATFGQTPRRAAEAVARHFARRDELACSDFLSWFDDADRLRGVVAHLMHCRATDIAFVPNAATALSLLIGGLDWRRGERIVTFQNEFPNNLYCPALVQRHGIELVETSWEGFWDALTPRTRLVAVSEVSYINGFRPPLAEIAARLRERGILLYVDGTQSLGALTFDAQAVQPDMYAVHAYKWLLSPNGAGFMYVSPALRERLAPNVIGWRSHRDWRNVDHLHHGTPEFSGDAEKYEGGMLTFPVLCAMEASLEMVLEIGLERIEERVLGLADELRGVLRGLGARLPADESPHFNSSIVAARFEGKSASEIAQELRARRILVSARHGHLRVSAHFYNNQEELAELEAGLKAVL